MTIRTLFFFLVGSREAILKMAGSRWSLVVGFLFVIAAGFARYYDSAYLVSEWTVMLRGIGISVFNSLSLFVVASLFATRGVEWKGFLTRYVDFLGLFWMTAPMAVLYAIPYERFLSPLDAVHANAWTLAFVSFWRVVLITRILSILLGVSWIAMLFPVLLFSDAAVLAASMMMPRPIVDLMGGFQLTEVEREISQSTFAAQAYSLLALPLLLIATLLAGSLVRRMGTLVIERRNDRPIGLLIVAGLSIVAWIPVLVRVQPEQQLRFRAEQLLRAGQVAEAIAEMSRHERKSYPPVWDPPPRLLYREDKPSMSDLRKAIRENPPAEWVSSIYAEKSWRFLAQETGFFFRVPTASEYAEQANASGGMDASALQFHIDFDSRLNDADKELLRKIVQASEAK